MISSTLKKLMQSIPTKEILKYKQLSDKAIPTLSLTYSQAFTDEHQKNQYEVFSDIIKARAQVAGLLSIPITFLPEEKIIGSKSEYIRGANLYPHYAVDFLEPLVEELKLKMAVDSEEPRAGTKEKIPATAKSYDQQSISQQDVQVENAHRFAANHPEFVVLGGKFLMAAKDRERLINQYEYWKDRCLKARADKFWENNFKGADYIKNGWEIGLYTAAHDSCIDGRIVLDYSMLLSRGLIDIKNEINEKISKHKITTPVSSGQHAFWRAASILCDGIIKYADKRRDYLHSLRSTDPNIVEMIKVLTQVPRYPARTFREAIQSFWLLYMIGHLEGSNLGYSPGRLDQYLYPYFMADVNSGKLSYEQAITLLQELFIKMSNFEYFASSSWVGLGAHNLYQNCMLGGKNASGESLDNELSKLIVIAQYQLAKNGEGLHQPTLSIWVHDRTDQELMEIAAATVSLGVGYPAFFNFDITRQHMLKVGVKEEDSYSLAMGGCTEPVIEGLNPGIVQAGFINLPKLLEIVLDRFQSPDYVPKDSSSLGSKYSHSPYEQIREEFLAELQTAITNWTSYFNYVMSVYDYITPQIVPSIFIHDCLDKGCSLGRAGARYNSSPTTLSSGLVDVANSLAVFSYTEKFATDRFTFEDIFQAMRDNFDASKGHGAVFKYVWEEIPKFGNNDPLVDNIFVEIFNEYCQMVKKEKNYLGDYYDPSSLAISTPVPFGKVCGASSFGRKAQEPISDGVYSPYPQTDRNGIISTLKSTTKFDGSQIRGGLLNLKLDPGIFIDQLGINLFINLIRSYIKDGGFHVQFNVIDAATMQEMLENPRKYEHRPVRVSGFTAKWGQLTDDVRKQIASRTLLRLENS